jgi:sporulation protein YlmC with PRC-barrel domain
MGYLFSDDDRNKDVVTSDGTHVGTVHEVRDDQAVVDRDDGSDLTEKVKNMLGWDDDDNEGERPNRIRGDHVDTVDDNTVRLRQH